MPAIAPPATAATEITVEARGAVSALYSRRDREVLLSGPAGTGKTIGCLWKLHLAALKYPGMRGLLMRKTGTALSASALVSFQNKVIGTGQFGVTFFGGSKLKPAQFEYPNRSVIVVGGMDNADKIMSTEYDLVYVNEALELDADDWESITTRLRNGIMPYQQLFADCNPGPPSHWLKRRCDGGKTLELASVHEDNPRYHDGVTWTDEGREYLATLDALTGHRYQRLRLGKWVAAEGLVYPSFHPGQITAVECAKWAAILAVDFGLRDPSVVLTIRYGAGRYHIEREFFQGVGASDLVEIVRAEMERTKAGFVVYDPAGAQIAADFSKAGLPARKADNAIVSGIQRVAAALPSLTVDPSCTNTIGEFGAYTYPKHTTSRDVPAPGNDHAMDALRYAIVELSDDGDVVSW